MYRFFKRSTALILSLLMMVNLSAVAATNTDGVAISMYWSENMANNSWNNAENNDVNTIFDVAGFEAGSEAVRYIKLQNDGKKAYSYVLDATYSGADSSLAEVVEVYVKEDVTEDVSSADMEKIGTLADVFGAGKLSEGKIIPGNETATEGYYNKERTLAVALKMPATVGAEYMNKVLDNFDITFTATECEFDYAKGEYSVKFPNTDKYLYRVGNMNTVAVGSLFDATNTIGDVNVTVKSIDETAGATGTFTPNASDWTKGTIQFEGTGAVEVTISDSGVYTEPVSVKLEVINAENITSAKSVEKSDAVLLNDVGFSSLTVKNGYTLYGHLTRCAVGHVARLGGYRRALEGLCT